MLVVYLCLASLLLGGLEGAAVHGESRLGSLVYSIAK